MKILSVIITPPYYKASGGVSAGLALSKAISKDIKITVCIMSKTTYVLKESSNLVVKGFHSHSKIGVLQYLLPKGFRNLFYKSNDLLKFIKKEMPDLVHIHNPHPIEGFCDVTSLCSFLKIPFVVSSHGFVEFSSPENWLGKAKIKRLLFNQFIIKRLSKALTGAAAIFFTSPQEVLLIKNLGISNKKHYIVTNGFNPNYKNIEYIKNRDRSYLRKYKIDINQATFFFLGNHTPNKGIDLLIESINKSQNSWNLIIGGAIRDQAYLDALCKKFISNSNRGRLVFTSYLSNDELLNIYSSVDGFVFPTRSDTLPLVILDAMAMGLPIITTNVGGIPYQVDATNGYFIEQNSSIKIAEMLDFLSTNDIILKEKGLCSFEKARKIFNWEEIAKSAISAYRELI